MLGSRRTRGGEHEVCSQRVTDLLQMGHTRDTQAHVLRRDHEEISVEGLYARKFTLDCSQHTGQHRGHVGIGSLWPIQQSDETLAGQRPQQILEVVLFPPCGASHGSKAGHGYAGKASPGPQFSGSMLEMERLQRAFKRLASPLRVTIEASHDQLGAQRRYS